MKQFVSMVKMNHFKWMILKFIKHINSSLDSALSNVRTFDKICRLCFQFECIKIISKKFFFSTKKCWKQRSSESSKKNWLLTNHFQKIEKDVKNLYEGMKLE